MKKLLCIPLLVLLYTCSYAQVQWFQAGDEWTYYVIKGWFPDVNGLNRLKVDKEVDILGEKWIRLFRYNPMSSSSPNEQLFVRQEGEKVFLRNGNPPNIPLYDFSLVPGDTLFFSTFSQWPHYVILDTGRVFLVGQERRTQTVQHSSGSVNYPLLLVEGIGPVGNPLEPAANYFCSYLVLFDNFCNAAGDGTSTFFRCFGNPQGVYAPFEGCLVDTKEQETAAPVQVWPNPADERLIVQGDCNALRLFDSQGRLVYESTPEPENVQVEILTANLPNGVYVLVCRLENGKLFSKRVCVLH